METASATAKKMENIPWISDRSYDFDAVCAYERATYRTFVRVCATFCARSYDSPMVIGTSLPGLRAMDGHSDFALPERPACLRRCLPTDLRISQAANPFISVYDSW